MVLLKLLPAFFEFDLLQLVVDGLGFCVVFRVALQLLELLDPLAVGFDHKMLQQLVRLFPRKERCGLVGVSTEVDALVVVVYIAISAVPKGIAVAADAIFLFQKVHGLFDCGVVLVEGIDPQAAILDQGTAQQLLLRILPGKGKRAGRLHARLFFGGK